jgi:hypothetical protein
MKASFAILLFAVTCSTRVAAQSNPYPTGCWNFTTETVYCSDVDPGQGSCHGSLPYVIDFADNDDGLYDADFGTLVCTGGTNRCQGNNSPTCPTCPNVTGYIVEISNPLCYGDGGGGPYCNCDDPECGDEECGLFRHAPKGGSPTGNGEEIQMRRRAAQVERDIFAADHRIELTIAGEPSAAVPAKP